MKVKTWLNADQFPYQGEINDQPSATVPDQSMTVKEILNRFARGLPLGGQRVPVFDGEEDDMPDIRTLDLAERQEMAENFKRELEEIRSNDAKRKARIQAKKAEKSDYEAYKRYLASMEKEATPEPPKSTNVS